MSPVGHINQDYKMGYTDMLALLILAMTKVSDVIQKGTVWKKV